mmetsp:Transcript_35500/g.80103  ORF Transcript_35500/g.80103 Transcript_35500/m.80103 type:complete len:148 (+) Transcript_35500:197-640(+)
MAPLPQWNPKLIICQMISLQCLFYLTLGANLGAAHVLFGTTLSLDHFFTSEHMNPASATGWIGIGATVLTSLVGSVLLTIVVEKSRKCLDFGSTIYIFHLIFCSVLRGCPSTWEWWIIHVVGLVVMVVIGEYLCSRVEMRDIPLVAI